MWDGDHIGVRTLWSYYCRYLYMPRLAGFGVLAAAIARGVADLNWQHDTFAYADTHDPEADRYPGLVTAAQVEVTQSLTAVLVRPARALAQLDAESQPADEEDEVPGDTEETWKPDGPGLLSLHNPPGSTAGRNWIRSAPSATWAPSSKRSPNTWTERVRRSPSPWRSTLAPTATTPAPNAWSRKTPPNSASTPTNSSPEALHTRGTKD